MSLRPLLLLLLALAGLAWLGSALPVDGVDLSKIQAEVDELKAQRQGETNT